MSDSSCNVCENASLLSLPQFESLPRVTSDCRPWPAGGALYICEVCGSVQKKPSSDWIEEVRQIYETYDIYQLSDGSEQVIFNSQGEAAPRSLTLVEHFVSRSKLPAKGRLIDIGCGNGSALRTFSKALPNWSFCGSELSDHALDKMRDIPGFDKLYTVPPGSISSRFDAVSLIHSLEHMPAPLECLADVMGILDDDGKLLIEVPDVESSLFDILIADHLSHFSVSSLRHLANRCGLKILECTSQILTKEITLIGSKGELGKERSSYSRQSHDSIVSNIIWLQDLLTSAKAEATKGPIGIFGTSISAMWLSGAMENEVAFFVDEDTTRVGKSIKGRPILSPQEVSPGERVFVPLIPSSAANVIQRLSRMPFRWIAP